MKARPRLIFGGVAVALALTGVVIGWAVAVGRQASTSDAIASALLTGVFTLLGSALGLGVPLFQDWERNRPNLRLQLAYSCLHATPLGFRPASETFPSTFSAAGAGADLRRTWLRTGPEDPNASLFLLLDVQAQNRSHLDDAITELTIELPSQYGTVRLPARLPDGSEFFGEGISAHQLSHMRLRLMLDRQNFEKTVNWNPNEHLLWRLVAKTINDQTIIEDIHPAGHFAAYKAGVAVLELDDWRL